MNVKPVVSKEYCSPWVCALVVRKRPHVVGGGGFVVTGGGAVLFSVDGCGVLGAGGELVVRDGDGAPILFIRRKGGAAQALSGQRRWNGYLTDDDDDRRRRGRQGKPKPVFCLKEQKACRIQGASGAAAIKISVVGAGGGEWDFEVVGSFADKAAAVRDPGGNLVAQLGMGEEEEEMVVKGSMDLYNVVVHPGHDQAFVVGLVAILDYMHGESTRC